MKDLDVARMLDAKRARNFKYITPAEKGSKDFMKFLPKHWSKQSRKRNTQVAALNISRFLIIQDFSHSWITDPTTSAKCVESEWSLVIGRTVYGLAAHDTMILRAQIIYGLVSVGHGTRGAGNSRNLVHWVVKSVEICVQKSEICLEI